MTAFHTLWRLLTKVPRRRRRQAAALAAFMLVGAIAELVTLGTAVPVLAIMADPGRALEYPVLARFFAALGWTSASELLLPLTVLFIVVALSAAAIRLGLLWATSRFSMRLGADLAADVFHRTLHQPYRVHISRNSSEIIASINKVQAVLTDVLTPVLQGVAALVLSVSILVMLFTVDPGVASVAAGGFAAAYSAMSGISRRRLRRNSTTIGQTYSRRVQAVQEGLGAIRDILLDGSQGVHADRFRRVNDAHLAAHLANTVVATAPRFFIEAFGVSLIAAIAYAMTLRPAGLLGAVPVLGALALGAQRLIPLLQQMYQAWAQLMGSHQIASDVIDLLDQPVPRQQVEADPTRLPFVRDLRLANVSFRYQPDGPFVLRDIDVQVQRGWRVGFAGRTGSGKSTLLDIVMGLLHPTGGELQIDGATITDANRRDWQAHIAHVPQSIFLADATIAENIAFGVDKRSIDMERVAWAARTAQLTDFIQSSTDGFHSRVGERGIQLSGGQRQRIGIARALYRRADVLVFDEATSALDDVTEAALMQALSTLPNHLTLLIVAHRLTTLRDCDMIVRLENGRIVDSSSPRSIGIAGGAANGT